MEEDSLNTASTFVKCALGRSPSVPSRRPPLARTQLQPISRKREQNNSYRGANTCAGTRAKETRKHRERSKMRARREHKAGVEERESERSRRILYPPPPRPMSPFRFLPSRPPYPPINPILEARRALPRASQARFLNFVTFKFKHSHLLRSPPPQRLCLLPMPISCPFPLAGPSFSPCLLSFFLILSLVYYLPSFVSLSVCVRLYFDFFCSTMKAPSAPTFP